MKRPAASSSKEEPIPKRPTRSSTAADAQEAFSSKTCSKTWKATWTDKYGDIWRLVSLEWLGDDVKEKWARIEPDYDTDKGNNKDGNNNGYQETR